MTAEAFAQLQTHGVVQSGQLRKFGGLRVKDGILYRRNRIIIPASLREEVLEMVHRTYHGGIKRTIEELKARFYWRGMYTDAERKCKRCMICLRNKRSYSPKQPLNPIEPNYKFPRATIAYDIATLPWSKDGFRYVCIIVDMFAKYIEAIPMKNQTAQSIVEALESVG